jgi:hypothetical protein
MRHRPRRAGALVAEDFSGPDKPALVIVGQGALNEADGEAVLAQAMKLAKRRARSCWSCTPPPPAWARWMWAR